MFDIIILIVILGALIGAGLIVIRKFPQLANLDVNNLPEELNERKKKEIINKRIDEQSRELKKRWAKYLAPIDWLWRQGQFRFRVYVGKIERLVSHTATKKPAKEKVVPVNNEETQEKVAQLIKEGEQAISEKDFNRAEERFIAAIKLDTRAVAAYRGLGTAYYAKKSIDEATETFKFVLQLDPNDDNTMATLAEIAEEKGDNDLAIEYYQRAVVANDSLSPRFAHLGNLLLTVGQPEVAKEAILAAVELEPQNPKYLDLLVETAILCRDRELALQGYNDLRLVNPENKKLPDLKERIDRL